MAQPIGNRPINCCTQIHFINAFRKLWTQHVMWTRSFIISTAADLGDLPFVTRRLMQNPTDFYNALKPYYGTKKAQEFRDLLTDHLSIAGNLVNAAKAGNTDAADAERKKWYANADDIARFLAGINPYWSMPEWQRMLHDHLKLTEDEAVSRLTGQYEKDVALYDVIEDQALMMADVMARGILRQF